MAAKRIKIRSEKSSVSRWLATGTLVACSTVGTAEVALAQAQPASSASQQSNSQNLLPFHINAAPLSEAISEFERITGKRVTLGQATMASVGSLGVLGEFTPDVALALLLTDTGLSFRTEGDHYLLEVRSTFRVEVLDTLPQVTSPRYSTTLRDTPQTISIVSSAVIQQQGATNLRDVLRNVPGITMTAGEGGTPAGDNITIRGNNARNDIFIDGSRDISSQSRDPFNMEQVEVTKGPTSVVTGRGSAGGTLNLVSKTPNLQPAIGGSFAYGNASTRRGTIDLNTPLPFLGERAAFRLNALAHDSGVPGRSDVIRNDRWGFAPALTFGLGTRTRLTLQYYKLKQSNISDYGIPWVPETNTALAAYAGRPAPVARETFYGIADRDHEFLNQDSGTVRFEHDFNDNISVRNQLRYGRAGRNSFASPPRFDNTTSIALHREVKSWVAHDNIWDNQTDVTAKFNTGAIGHSVNLGAAFSSENNIRLTRTAPNSPTSLYSPNPFDSYDMNQVVLSPIMGNITGKTQAGWLFDTVRLFNDHVELLGGLRFERFAAHGINTTNAPINQVVNMPNVRTGLTYKPVRSGSIYFAYGTSASPSLEGLSYSTSTTSIPPEKTKNMETGIKWDLLHGRVLAQGALFRVAKENARTPGVLPTDPPQVLAGVQVSKGVELSLTGALTRNFRILSSYTLVDARIGKSNTPAEVGRIFTNTPRNSASVWAMYTRSKFSLGVGPRWVGKRFGNNANTRWVDAYWTMDLMVGYTLNRHADFRFNLSNLNDSYYFDRLSGGHLVPGAGRGALLSLNFHL